MGGRGSSYISSVPKKKYRYFTPEPEKSYHSYLGNYDVDVIRVKGAGYYSKPQTIYLDRKKRLTSNNGLVAYDKKYIEKEIKKQFSRYGEGNQADPAFAYGIRGLNLD